MLRMANYGNYPRNTRTATPGHPRRSDKHMINMIIVGLIVVLAPHPGAPGALAAGVGVAAPLLAGEGEVAVSVGGVEVPPHLLRPAHTRPKHRLELQTIHRFSQS